jgi:hypothetical protein
MNYVACFGACLENFVSVVSNLCVNVHAACRKQHPTETQFSRRAPKHCTWADCRYDRQRVGSRQCAFFALDVQWWTQIILVACRQQYSTETKFSRRAPKHFTWADCRYDHQRAGRRRCAFFAMVCTVVDTNNSCSMPATISDGNQILQTSTVALHLGRLSLRTSACRPQAMRILCLGMYQYVPDRLWENTLTEEWLPCTSCGA